MNKEILLFSIAQGSVLIKLLLSHVLADFVLQTKTIAEKKKGLNRYMFLHLAIVSGCTFLLSNSIIVFVSITLIHAIIDIGKSLLEHKCSKRKGLLFTVDQVLHLVTIVVVWSLSQHITAVTATALLLPFSNYVISLYTLAYAFVIWPATYIVKFVLENIPPTIIDSSNSVECNDQPPTNNRINAGALIGQFERIIILTLVLIGQYEAIGFLITGKSIIRFMQSDESLRSEYVLAGTMISYSIAILTGVLVTKLLALV